MFDFVLLKIAGVAVLVWVGWVAVKVIKNHLPWGTAADVTVDDIKADAAAALGTAETYLQAATAKAEAYTAQKLGLEAAIVAIQADIEKAKDTAAKIKAVF